MVAVRSKVEWSFATVTIGEQSVMIGGAHLMPEWSVGSSVIPVQVIVIIAMALGAVSFICCIVCKGD